MIVVAFVARLICVIGLEPLIGAAQEWISPAMAAATAEAFANSHLARSPNPIEPLPDRSFEVEVRVYVLRECIYQCSSRQS